MHACQRKVLWLPEAVPVVTVLEPHSRVGIRACMLPRTVLCCAGLRCAALCVTMLSCACLRQCVLSLSLSSRSRVSTRACSARTRASLLADGLHGRMHGRMEATDTAVYLRRCVLSLSLSSRSRVRTRACSARTRASLLAGASSTGSISDSAEPCTAASCLRLCLSVHPEVTVLILHQRSSANSISDEAEPCMS